MSTGFSMLKPVARTAHRVDNGGNGAVTLRSTSVEITQTKLAELAGVSQNTVHRALHGMSGVSEETRQRIHSLAATHGYRLNTAARNMRTGRTGQIGVLVLDTPSRRYVHPALFELSWGVNAGLDAAGYVTTLVRLTDVDRPNAEEARIFREHLLDGVIVANMLPDALMKKVEHLVANCIWLDTNIWRSHDCLQRDEEHAGRLAARALIEAGHKRIVHFVRPESTGLYSDQGMAHYSNQARQRGLTEEAAVAGVELIPVEMNDLSETPADTFESYLLDGAGLYLNRLSEARRIAVLGSGPMRARWARDYSVACADDGADVEWWWPELTRVKFDRLGMGHAAAEMMVAKLNGDTDGATSRRIQGRLLHGSTLRPR